MPFKIQITHTHTWQLRHHTTVDQHLAAIPNWIKAHRTDINIEDQSILARVEVGHLHQCTLLG